MKMKRMLALLLCVATMFTLVSTEIYAADYTVTVKSNDGKTTLFATNVPRSTVLTFEKDGLSFSSGESYVYDGEQSIYGFATSASASAAEYAAGDMLTVTSALTLYVCEGAQVGGTIVGDPVEGATSYELYEKDPGITFGEEVPYYVIFKCTIYRTNGEVYSTDYYCFASALPKVYLSAECAMNSTKLGLHFGEEGITTCYKIGTNSSSLEGAVNACLTASVRNGKYVSGDRLNASGSVEVSVLYSNGVVIEKYTGSSSFKTPFEEGRYDVPYRLEGEYELKGSADSIYFNLSDYVFGFGQHTLAVKAKGDGYFDSDFSNEVVYEAWLSYSLNQNIVNAQLVNLDGGNLPSVVYDSRSFSAKLVPTSGYLLPNDITVTMGGKTLTNGTGYRYYPETGAIVIPNVTSAVSITAEGVKRVVAPTIERNTELETAAYPVVLTFAKVSNASAYSVYVGGAEATAVEWIEDGNVITAKLKTEAFPISEAYQIYVVAQPVDGYVASNPSNVITATVAVQIATPVATAKPDLRTDEYPFVCEVTKPANATALTCYMNGNLCGTVVYQTNESGNWIVYFPMSVFDGSGEYEVYFVAHGGSTDFVESESSNSLTVTISKLATPVIWLE